MSLPNVTLIGVADNFRGLNKAADYSCAYIRYSDVKMLSGWHNDGQDKIRLLGSKKEYSKFVLKELADYISTDYLILFQADGFVINWKAWDNDFYNYDYIGAVWNFRSEKQVGNGGFSFRSRRLQEILRDDENIVLKNDHIINNFAEDHNICYIYREYLEEKYGIKFAPVEICEKFSIEAWGVHPPGNRYSGSFGFHGFSIDFSQANLPYIPYLLPNPQRKIN